MKTSSHLYDIPILEENGTNFQTWKYRICTVLNIHRLINIAEGKKQHLSQILMTGMGNNAAKAYTAQIEKIEDWDCCNKEAKAQITLTLSDEPLSRVIHAIFAADAWNKLNRQYEDQGHQIIAQLIGKIFRTTFTNDSLLKPQSSHSPNTQPLSYWFSHSHRDHPPSSQNILYPKDHLTLHSWR